MYLERLLVAVNRVVVERLIRVAVSRLHVSHLLVSRVAVNHLLVSHRLGRVARDLHAKSRIKRVVAQQNVVAFLLVNQEWCVINLMVSVEQSVYQDVSEMHQDVV